MSNYSTFFPSGTASGGGSAPMNSYAALRVAGTGNPTGYDATTGLYIQESGEAWLKSGSTITSSDYPLGLGGGSKSYSAISPFVNKSSATNQVTSITYVKTSGKYWAKNQTTFHEVTASGSTWTNTGQNFDIASSSMICYNQLMILFGFSLVEQVQELRSLMLQHLMRQQEGLSLQIILVERLSLGILIQINFGSVMGLL